jgi:hypothetical protein
MTLSALGIFSAAGAGGLVAASDYELIESTILTSAAASVTFSSLGTYSSTYKHLQVRWTARATTTGSFQINLRFNGSSTGYANHRVFGTGTGRFSSGESANPEIRLLNAFSNTSVASAFTGGVLDLLDSYSTTKNKTIRTLYGQRDGLESISFVSGLWENTSSTTSLSFTAVSNNFAIGSRFSLYGIKG